MKLTFLGTRGNIKYRNKWHYFHASLLVQQAKTRILIDCGEDWRDIILKNPYKAQAIFITHAHSDHAGGLVDGAPCPVYATQDSWQIMRSYAIQERHVVKKQQPIQIGSLKIEAFIVDHSLRAPAVGYRISTKDISFFYVPDLIKIHDQKTALRDVHVYIGDGAIVTRTILERERDHVMIGHTPIEKQLQWCKKERVERMIVTHCGSEIVKHDEETMREIVENLGQKYGVSVCIAYDGMVVDLKYFDYR
jgi:phosphoribosyl 1,2-cyclic phosphodiesterase